MQKQEADRDQWHPKEGDFDSVIQGGEKPQLLRLPAQRALSDTLALMAKQCAGISGFRLGHYDDKWQCPSLKPLSGSVANIKNILITM